jgi:NAD(P)-dependent dehydrogenase (short-subunit alcohol dehydrogenase family)
MANTQKTAIVTGASQGIGAGLVEAFLKRGYNVVGKFAKHYESESVPQSEQSYPSHLSNSRNSEALGRKTAEGLPF